MQRLRAQFMALLAYALKAKAKAKASATLENAGFGYACASTTHLSLSATAPLLAYALLTLGAVPSAARSNAAALRAAKKRVYLAACAAQASSAAPANRRTLALRALTRSGSAARDARHARHCGHVPTSGG